jgi:hypothetical protein
MRGAGIQEVMSAQGETVGTWGGDGAGEASEDKVTEDSLITLQPHDSLTFTLQELRNSKATMRVSNTSGKRIIFKVKTRRPKWWHVTPVQQELDVGQNTEVHITLVEAECTKFVRERGIEIEAKYRLFLVQSRLVTDAEYASLVAENTSTHRAETFTKLWSPALTPPGGLNLLKLKVHFKFPGEEGVVTDGAGAAAGVAGRPTSAESFSAKVDNIRDKIAAKAKWSSGDALGATGDRAANETPLGDENTYAKLQALTKKFDTILEYTCHLTQERDVMALKIKDLKRQQARDVASKDEDAVPGDDFRAAIDDEKTTRHGFSLFFTVFVAFLAFFLGRFLRGSGEL